MAVDHHGDGTTMRASPSLVRRDRWVAPHYHCTHVQAQEQRGAHCLDSYIDHQAGLLKTRGTGQQRDAGKAATSTVAVATLACNPLSGLGQLAIREVSARA